MPPTASGRPETDLYFEIHFISVGSFSNSSICKQLMSLVFGSCKFFPAKVSEGVLLKTSLNPLKCYFLVQIRQKRANTIILILRETAQDVIAFAPHPPPLRIGVLVDKNACNDTEKNSYNEEL